MQHFGNGGTLWRVLAVILGFWALPAHAASSEPVRTENEIMKEYLIEHLLEYGWTKVLLLLVVAIAASFFVSVGMAKLFAKEHATYRNVVRYYLTSLMLIAVSAVFCVGIGAFFVWRASAGGVLFAVLLQMVAFLVVAFAVPMVIFDFGWGRAFLMNLLSGASYSMVIGGALAVFPSPFPELAGKNEKQRREIIAEWDMKRRHGELEERLNAITAVSTLAPGENLAEELQKTYLELLQAREKLDISDLAAVAAFNTQVSEYNAAKARLVPASAPVAAGVAVGAAQ